MNVTTLPSYEEVKSFVVQIGQNNRRITAVDICDHFNISSADAGKFITDLEEDGALTPWTATRGRQLCINYTVLPDYEEVKAFVIMLGQNNAKINTTDISQKYKLTTHEAHQFIKRLEADSVITPFQRWGVGRRLKVVG